MTFGYFPSVLAARQLGQAPGISSRSLALSASPAQPSKTSGRTTLTAAKLPNASSELVVLMAKLDLADL